MKPLNSNPNVDNADLVNYPDGRIKDNGGSGNGTGVNRAVYGDIHSNISKLMRLYDIAPNGLPDNETNGYQIIEAIASLASKNDFILPITSNGTTLSVPIKIGKMLNNESVICKANVSYTAEALIKGTDAPSFSVTLLGIFNSGEYVRLIKTGGTVTLIRIADQLTIDDMVSEYGYLKAATQAEENAGAINTKATTPLTNLVAFVKRVIGADSVNYLATAIRNGLYPKEHFAIVDGLIGVKNYGTVSLDVGGSGSGPIPATGDFTATVVSAVSDSIVTVTMANPMSGIGTEYYVRIFLEGLSANIGFEQGMYCPVFKAVSNTTFQLGLRESGPVAQSLRVHMEVVQL
jgi:hypothetical protein